MINNLPPDFLYNKIPDGILKEDMRLLLRAVVGGFQTQLAEMRTLADQIRELWVPDNSVGEPYPVVVVTYTDPESFETRQITLNVNDSTPDSTASMSDVFTWCADQIGVDVGQITDAEFTTDQARTAESRTLLLLADTIGAKLYENLSTVDAEIILNQKCALKTYFSRLKVKGTALSFELLGRLHGFDDVKFIPLWGRVSPRIPNNIGAVDNDPDFSQNPQGLPTPGQPSVIYDPTQLNDGDIYIWQSGQLSVNESQTDYIITNVNGFNPYVTIEAVGATTGLKLPVVGTYYLGGGTFGKNASTEILPAADSTSSGFQFVAIADGASFNGTQIVVAAATAPDGSPRVLVTIYHNLSSIKFRTSYFNLSAAVSYDTYSVDNTITAQTSSDLKSDPSLWHDLASLLPGNAVPFANDGVASDPFRPWSGGSRPMPTVVTWPDLMPQAGGGSPTNRIQASVDTPALDLTSLIAGDTRLVGHIDDVRPATRNLRKFQAGLSVSSQIQYAPHISRKLLTSILTVTTYAGSTGTVEVDYPTLPYTGSFVVGIRVQTFLLDMTPVSDITTEYDVTSESLPVTPAVVDLSFVHPIDGNLLAFTGTYDFINSVYSITVTACGYTGVSNIFVVTASFYGLWQAIGIDRLQSEPPVPIEFADIRHYQLYPEDELELTYQYALDDSYPWCRTVAGGGEQISENVENTDKLNLRQLLMRNVVQVVDERQQVYDVTGVDTAPGDRGYPILIQNTDDAIGQRPIGFQLIVEQNTLRRQVGPHHGLRVDNPVGNQDNETEHGGPLSTILHVQLGDPYVVDSVRGVLVADGPAHWTKAQSESLVAWYHMGEHPQQPYLLNDYSDLALTETELEAGAFSSNYFLKDRVWDNQRGWMLRLRGQAPKENPLQTAGFIKVNKNRLVGNNYTISFWVKNIWNDSQTHLPEMLIFEYGPVVIKFGAGVYFESLQTYVKDGITGVLKAVGDPVAINEITATFYSFSVSSLEPASTIPVNVCAITDVSILAGLQIIDGVQLIEGMTILLIGQTDPIQNGHYFVYETGWIRVEAIDGVNELGLYFQVTGGVANAGLYQNTNTSPFVYGSDGITYARYNVKWRGTMSQDVNIDTPDIFQPYQTSDTLLTFTAPQEDNSSDLIISDLKIWATGKTAVELNIIQSPPFRTIALSARPTFFLSTRGAYRGFQVLSSGYVFPSIQALDYYAERLARAIRYNGRGEYVGPDSRLLVGYGDWKPITSSMTLGLVGPDLKSQGTSVGASTSSDLPGFNTFWYADATLGFYKRVPVPYIAGGDSDNTTLVAEPTSSNHPTEMPVQNPDQAFIFVLGQDGNMYKVVVEVLHLNAGDIVSLVAKLAGQKSVDSQLTEQDYILSAGETSIEIATEPDFYNLIANYPSDDVFQQEFVTGAETLVSQIDATLTLLDTLNPPTANSLYPSVFVPGHNLLFVGDYFTDGSVNNILVIDPTTDTVQTTFSLSNSDQLMQMVYGSGQDKIYVGVRAETGNSYIAVIDPVALTTTTIDIGSDNWPVSLAYDAGRDALYVLVVDKTSTANATVRKIDCPSNTFTGDSFVSGQNGIFNNNTAQSLLYLSSVDRIYLGTSTNGIYVIDPTSFTSTVGIAVNAVFMYYSSLYQRIYTQDTGNTNIYVIDPLTNTIIFTTPQTAGLFGITDMVSKGKPVAGLNSSLFLLNMDGSPIAESELDLANYPSLSTYVPTNQKLYCPAIFNASIYIID